METVITMPILLTLVFGIAQMAILMSARAVARRAAYAAARAALVSSPGERQAAAQAAAETALSWVSLADWGEGEMEVPGWGSVYGSGSIHDRVRASVSSGDALGGSVSAEMEFAFPLMIPAMGVDRMLCTGDETMFGWRFASIRETCTISGEGTSREMPSGGFGFQAVPGGAAW